MTHSGNHLPFMCFGHVGWAQRGLPVALGSTGRLWPHVQLAAGWVFPGVMRVAGPYLFSSSSLAPTQSQDGGLRVSKCRKKEDKQQALSKSLSCSLLSHQSKQPYGQAPCVGGGLHQGYEYLGWGRGAHFCSHFCKHFTILPGRISEGALPWQME